MEFLLDLLKISVIAGAATAALGLLGPVLRRRYHAKWRYWVWLCLAALLLSPLIPLPKLETGTAYRAPVQVEVPAMEVRYGGGEGLALTPRTTLTVPVSPAEPASSPAKPAEEEPEAPAAEAEQSAVQTPAARRVPVETVALALWAAGAAASLLWVLGGTALFSRRCMRWARRADEATEAVLAEEQQALGFSKPVALYVTSGTASPAAMGLLRRRIVLPEADYEEKHLRFVLRHELVHLKRRDLWVQLLLCAARAVHWFNPLIWLLVRQARADMELTCDDAVLAGAEQGERRAYSETLLAMLHRQRSGALTTHFYGGKELMKERFRNIMAGKGRRWGAAALCIALLLTAAALGMVACTALQPEALTEEELAMWQERVGSEEWYGFFVNCYSDAEHLDLDEIFRYGAGIAREVTDPEEKAEALKLTGELAMGQTLRRMTRTDMDQFLREKTGLTLEDLAHTWDYAPYSSDGEVYYIAPFATSTPYMGNAPRITGGERMGDTVTLTVDLTDSGYYGHGGGMERAVMTIEDGKVASYTNEVFNAAETAAEEHLQNAAVTLTDLGLTVERQEMGQPYLRGWDRGGYTLWGLEEKLQVQETEEEALALLGEDWYWEGGWLYWRSAGSQCLVAEKKDDQVAVLTVDQEEMEGWPCFGAYARYGLGEGLQLTQWPLDLTELIASCLNMDDPWIFQRDEVARQYVEALGEEAASLTVAEDDLVGDGAGGTVALMEAETASGQRLRLVLREASADAVSTNLPPESYWQVVAAGTEEGELPDSHIPLPIFYDWLSPEDQAMYWQLSRSCYQVDRPPEAADFALTNGVELGMTVEEVLPCLGGTPGPYSAYLHMGGSIGLDYDQIGYSFYHTPEGEQLISIRLPAGAELTAASTGFGPESTVGDVLAALGYPDHPLRNWAQDILYGDPAADGPTGRFAFLSYTTILDQYSIYRREGAVSIQYQFAGDNTLSYIDLRLDSGRFLTTLGPPIPPAGVTGS